MTSHQSIIDRDIEQYEGDVEHHSMMLLRCPSGQEWLHRRRRDAAASAANALRVYRDALRADV
ncbi:hypothetical protein [Xanthomonas campestris]|uniref:hypothetical protein n=1 Tax=Xanthomonas campestris TaxID=339 RepID=UPI0005AF1993|nr:hypothetical protein [Xanthomonas campestris]KIQ27502.1 hypothetical protein RT95_07360 [Xanthomonas campestris]